MKKAKNVEYVNICFSIPKTLKERLASYSEKQEHGVEYTYILRKALVEYLDAHEVVDNSERK